MDKREARVRVLRSISFPAALILVIQSICFSTLSFEYHTVTLLAMIPAIVVWIERDPCVPGALKAVTAFSFGLLLLVTFRVLGFGSLFDSFGMTVVYALFAVLLFLECVCIVWFTEPSGWTSLTRWHDSYLGVKEKRLETPGLRER